MTKYEVLSCDTWGNAVEGYEVNELHRTGDTVEIPDGARDDDIFLILRGAGILTSTTRRSSVGIDDMSLDGLILVNDERRPRLSKSNPEKVAHGWCKPELQLRAIE